ncbi:MAG: hypothetical protein OEZ02_06105, partial [Anaerolineae bacterium]|nr:hypothetical protein [Anaerolineae bacterium]
YSFAAISFGSLMPHSLTAKEFAYRMQPLSALVRLIQHYATPFMGNLTLGIPWIGIGGLLYLFLFTLGAFRLIKQQPFLWPFVLFPWFYLAAFAIQNPLIFRWYLTPPLPFYIFVVLAGLDHLTSQVFSAKSSRLQFSGLLPVLLVILAPALLIAKDWRLHPTHGLQTPAPEMAYYELELLYKRVADELAPMVQSYAHTPTLAAGDVGILGYYTSARILDTVGLISPETIAYYPLDDYYYDEYTYAVSADLILDHKPDFIVILEVYGRTGLLVDPRFIKAYQLYKKIPTNIYGSDGMLIFVPRTSP